MITDLYAFRDSENARLVGKPFPDFQVKLANSKSFSNADLKNKVVFINFWFANCGPCIAEMKGLARLYDTLKNKKNFMFISFTFDHDSISRKMITKYRIRYKVFHISKSECKRLNFDNGYPTSFILDRNGVIKFFTTGAATDEEFNMHDILDRIYPEIIKRL